MLTHPGSKIAALAVVAALASVPRPALEEAPRPLPSFFLPEPGPSSPSSLSPLAPLPPLHEQPLDLDVPPPPPRRTVPAPPRRPAPVDGWSLTDPNMPRVRTPADEDLPSWCPIAGRLTVVSACDIAENLGLAPLGTAKNGGCPDAVQLIERENEARRRALEAR